MKLPVEKPVANHVVVPHGGVYSSEMPFNSKLIDFSSNVNPVGFPSLIKKELERNYGVISEYPDPSSSKLRNSLEKYTGIPKNQITVGNGATEIIYNFCKAFLRDVDVLIPVPTFGEYESAAKLHGAHVHFLKINEINSSIDKIVGYLPRNGCVFICNPNNPTGSLTDLKNMKRIIESAHRNSTLVFVDESFIEFEENMKNTVVPFLQKFENLFVLRSLTKSYGLAGLRIGYGLGSIKMISIIDKIRIPWNVSGLAQNIAIKALSDSSHLLKTQRLIAREKKFLKEQISKIDGFVCYDSKTNFLLIKSQINSKDLQRNLLKKNILVRDCSTFRGLGNRHIRVAVRTRRENLKLINALKRI